MRATLPVLAQKHSEWLHADGAMAPRHTKDTKNTKGSSFVQLVAFVALGRLRAVKPSAAGVSRQELIETLNDFLLSLLPLRATALLIIDEAQNLPRPVLEQIRMLSNLETDKEKLLQIILVGQLNLKDVLRTPELRQLDQRVSIRYNLKPLNGEETGRVRGAPPDDRRRRLGGELHAEGAAGRAPHHGGHPAADQSRLRPRAARAPTPNGRSG